MREIITLLLVCGLFVTFANGQTTEFTYQGSLKSGSTPSSGDYDFEFRLFAEVTGGSAITAVQSLNVSVVNGVFSAKLNFGNQFPGDPRYVEIGVRPAGSGNFQTLSPRQPILSTPYAIRAANASQLGGVAANEYVLTGDARLSDARTPLPNSPDYVQNRNTGTQASTNFSISGNGFVGGVFGIGQFPTNPSHKLHVSGAGVIRANVNSDSNVGLGLSLNNQMKWSVATVSPGQFQLFNETLLSNALWIENANNNVGIGVTNPGYLLDVGQRMRLRSGGNNNASAGIHLNNNANNVAAFMGMEDDTHIGFFGNNGAGWKFGMNTVTGALKVNGTEGQAGQVITSNGSSTAQWKSPTNALYQQTNINLNSGGISPGGTATTIPGLSQTVTVSGNAKLLVQFGVKVQGDCCFTANAFIDTTLNGGFAQSIDQTVANNSSAYISGSWLFSVGAGTHTVEIKAHSTSAFAGPLSFGGAGVGSLRSHLIVQVIPE